MSLLYKQKFFVLFLVLLQLLVGSKVYAAAEAKPVSIDTGRLTILDENDYFVSHDDRHYTQGARLSYLSNTVTPNGFWDQPYQALSSVAPVFAGGDHKRKYDIMFGQSLFTPQNTDIAAAQPKDRTYAAWLYTGVGLLQETRYSSYDTLENFELLGGVIGRWALGSVTQNDYHQFISVQPSLGWNNEVKNEPGIVASYERKWRFQQPLMGNLAVDAIPELGVSAGNIMTYGEGGMLLRIGQNLAADYGATHIRPSLSATDWFNADRLDGQLGWALFLGTQGRAVARNIFLDGNSFSSAAHVDKRIFVTDFMGGASVFWSNAVRFDMTMTQRTKEFYGQTGHPDRFGGVNLTIQFF